MNRMRKNNKAGNKNPGNKYNEIANVNNTNSNTNNNTGNRNSKK